MSWQTADDLALGAEDLDSQPLSIVAVLERCRRVSGLGLRTLRCVAIASRGRLAAEAAHCKEADGGLPELQCFRPAKHLGI